MKVIIIDPEDLQFTKQQILLKSDSESTVLLNSSIESTYIELAAFGQDGWLVILMKNKERVTIYFPENLNKYMTEIMLKNILKKQKE